MPWTSIGDVPAQVKTHKGILLTLAQANKWASIYDAIKDNPDLENPAAVAWATWEKLYIIKDDKWTLRKVDDKKISDVVTNLFEEHKVTGDEFIWAAFRKSEFNMGWHFSTLLLVDEPTEEIMADILWEGEYKLYKMAPSFAEVVDTINGFIDELPEADMEFTITVSTDVQQTKSCGRKELAEGVMALFCLRNENSEVQSVIFDKDKFTRNEAKEWCKDHDFKSSTSRETENQWRFRQFPPGECEGGFGQKSEKKYMEEVVFIIDSEVKVSSKEGENTIVHGVAVTLNVSNNHRFPEDVLDRDIGTLIGQPLVEGHSMWPMDVEVKDMYGMVIDAWYNRDKKYAEFYAEVWDENYKTVLDKMPHRVKFSVAFQHDFDVEKDEDTVIHVSNSVSFDHIGTTNRPADTDSVLLGIKQDAEARGRCVRMEGKRTIVVEPAKLVDVEGGNNMPEDDNTDKPEEITEPVPPVVEPETPPVVTDEVSEPEVPPAEPPAPDEESEDAGDETEKIGKRLEDMNTVLKVEQDKRKELETKVQAFERAEKRSKVEAYVNSLVDAKVKVPSQKDALVEQYLSFNEEQMKREMEINEISADLSELFGEKAVITITEEEGKVPDRKTIT